MPGLEMMCWTCTTPRHFVEWPTDAQLHCTVCDDVYRVQRVNGQITTPGEIAKMAEKHEHVWVDKGNGWKECSCGAKIHMS